MKKTILLIACTLVWSGLIAQGVKISMDDMKVLAARMAGEFNSEEQSLSDTAYFHIKLRMKPIWQENKEGYWFYVEQSLATKQDKPYRQRVYHLYKQDDTTVVSKVYEIKNPLQYTGGWKDTPKLEKLSMDSLIDRQGCSIYLHKTIKGDFTGSTREKECLSSLRGATYATSEVTVYADKLVSWDRGWDKDNKQVWGAEKGGYVFIKEKGSVRIINSTP